MSNSNNNDQQHNHNRRIEDNSAVGVDNNSRVRPPVLINRNELSNIVASNNAKRGKYIVVSPANKLLFAKQSVRIGTSAVIEKHHRLDLKYSSVAKWRSQYKSAKHKKEG